jgi:hypothetical protein
MLTHYHGFSALVLVNAVTAEVDLVEANFTGLATYQALRLSNLQSGCAMRYRIAADDLDEKPN